MESDTELVAAAKRGDREALGRLLERHQAKVYRFGMRMCRGEEDAKDVLQETLIAAARTLPDFREASSLSTWLYTIARSFCIKQRRKSKFAPEFIESLDVGEPSKAALQLADPRAVPTRPSMAEGSSRLSTPPSARSSPSTGRCCSSATSRGSRRPRWPRCWTFRSRR